MVSDLVKKKMVSDNANKTWKIYLSKILWTPEYGNLMEVLNFLSVNCVGFLPTVTFNRSKEIGH